jgi:hypothetical protein
MYLNPSGARLCGAAGAEAGAEAGVCAKAGSVKAASAKKAVMVL